jgi:hypothetical protein
MDEFPPIPATPVALAARWLARDLLYEQNVRLPLPASTVQVVRDQRCAEANRLRDRKVRAKMWRKAKSWEQPKHSEFGSLADWLE